MRERERYYKRMNEKLDVRDELKRTRAPIHKWFIVWLVSVNVVVWLYVIIGSLIF